MEHVIAGKFKLGRKIGSGSFGELYLAINVQTGEEVAVKLVCDICSWIGVLDHDAWLGLFACLVLAMIFKEPVKTNHQ
ncbi:casein kinase 1-like protein 11 [Carya illinoinensis]|uniref:Protein kinase domain-containing protein n=1 Tax=Carya illinoinensis TaxID=32201 RepID=A0A922E3L2_CARIL|nr:casein kinase 1-like protein 11 [Carya illinoinensis]KAG6696009.1 hypothetical protein I3842_09G125700 [Carya illinoinensis]KAG6696010.1 hypothetical protein I3842_09G125700 [Carya illinoinensis]KAG6696011.1 hypothetical protein I3842_09G125700 [Carya illinoinensis]